jgi:DNA polymerase-3 subunit gamma/tau
VADDDVSEDYDAIDVDAYAYLDSMQPVEEYATPAAAPVEEPQPAAMPATGLAAEWLELFPKLGLAGMTASIAANCTLVAVDGDRWHLHLDPGQSALFNASQQRRLSDALSSYHGRALTLQIDVVRPEQETPAQAAARQRAERQREAEASIHADPLVRQMKEQFAAVIRDGTIVPLEN